MAVTTDVAQAKTRSATMKKIEAIVRPEKVDDVRKAIEAVGGEIIEVQTGVEGVKT